MEKLSHAYNISSPSAKSGLSAARELASEMLCASNGKRPCGVCRDCRKIKNGVHPDVAVISRIEDENGVKKNEILIGQIRDMRASAAVLPNEAKGKVYIIAEAETMNERAQNAALKLLEEPPAGVYFILVTTNPQRLLITVRSRCVLIHASGEDDAPDGELSGLASEYIRLAMGDKHSELTAWCFENEKLDSKRLPELLNRIRELLTGMLRCAEDKRRVLYLIRLIDRCLEYQTVNTSVKHIFGLLAVKTLPAMETRKKVD